MDEIRREALTRDHIRYDLIKYEKYRLSCKQSTLWDFAFFFIYFALAGGAIAGVVFKLTAGLIVGGIIALPSVYNFVRMIVLYKDSLNRRRMIINGEFSIATSTLTGIGEDQVYEPHVVRRRLHCHLYRTVPFFFFEDVQWRVVQTLQHYEWSELYSMSYQGLKNTSIIGDKFYVVYLDRHGDACYIYNTKLFQLKDCTAQSKWSGDESED
ncbi:MAG: hypothetical protein IKC59_03600 [Clostridia bacterium]|nr:hypothetical protein [Clostridia bacterium]